MLVIIVFLEAAVTAVFVLPVLIVIVVAVVTIVAATAPIVARAPIVAVVPAAAAEVFILSFAAVLVLFFFGHRVIFKIFQGIDLRHIGLLCGLFSFFGRFRALRLFI